MQDSISSTDKTLGKINEVLFCGAVDHPQLGLAPQSHGYQAADVRLSAGQTKQTDG
ncbi:MAG: hypothetical protein ACPG47_07815 [Leucothrix sp.]